MDNGNRIIKPEKETKREVKNQIKKFFKNVLLGWPQHHKRYESKVSEISMKISKN